MSLEEQEKTKHAGSAADVRRIDGNLGRTDVLKFYGLISLPNNPTESAPFNPYAQHPHWDVGFPFGHLDPCYVLISDLRTHLGDNSEQDRSTHPNNPNTQLILPTIRILGISQFAGIFIRTEPTEMKSAAGPIPTPTKGGIPHPQIHRNGLALP